MTDATARGTGKRPELEAAAWRLLGPSLSGEPSPILGRPTWTTRNAQLLPSLVTGENADMGDRGFLEKLEDQLRGQDDDVIVFAAELLWVHVLPLDRIKPQTKIDRVARVLSWAPSQPKMPTWMIEASSLQGAFGGGTGFNMLIWQQMLWLCRFVETWTTAEPAERERALADPWAFGVLAARTPEDQPAIRGSLEYLVWPGYYEPIVNFQHRRRIRNAFAHEIGGPTGEDELSVDRDLHAIQEQVTQAAGGEVDWYTEPYESQWKQSTRRSGSGRRAWLVRAKQGGPDLVHRWISDGFVSLAATNLDIDPTTASSEQVRKAIESGYAHLTYAQRLTMSREYSDFITKMETDDLVIGILDDSLIVGTILGDPELASAGLGRLRRAAVWSSNRPSLRELPEPLPAVLDGQGVVVDVTSAIGVLDQYFDDAGDETDDLEPEPELPIPPSVAVVPDLPAATDELAASVHMPREDLQEMIEVLQDRQQLVFYGPPGTGKTFVAQAIARHVVGTDRSRVRLVQFHPSYAYEDFFEGLRPTTDSGTVTFELKPGPLRQIADEAELAENAGYPYVLIIDEMNRGNLAKVFGELYYLLEYRNETIRLQYSADQPFRLPKNLFIIGTMNTVDRSISLVDAAIRRRFPFVELHPSVEPTRSVLESYLKANHADGLRARLLAELNSRIDERDLQIGPSYLMKSGASTQTGLERIWKYDILPLLEDHYYGQRSPEVIREQFGLDALLAAVSGPGPIDLSMDAQRVEYEGQLAAPTLPPSTDDADLESE